MLNRTNYKCTLSANAGWSHGGLLKQPKNVELRVSKVHLGVSTAVDKADCLKKFQSEKAEAQRISRTFVGRELGR
jgi:hypothetical protein